MSIKSLLIPLNFTRSIDISGVIRVTVADFEVNLIEIIILKKSTNKSELHTEIAVHFEVITTPHRAQRILWDQFHNLKFPESGYVPRDSLTNFDYPFDWHGDHPFTNFNLLFYSLRKQGYFLEILRGPFECFDSRNYGTLLLVDPEEKFSDSEISKLEHDIMVDGLNLVIFAEWYDRNLLDITTIKEKNIKPITGYLC